MTAPTGRAWVFGDNINTDLLSPGAYMKRPLEELAQHCLEALDPDFAAQVRPGDVLVAGDNFGMGSSREPAVSVLVELGVGAVVARSFARIFYRNALNLGLPVLVCAEAGAIAPGDQLRVDAGRGVVEVPAKNARYACEPIPEHLLAMIADGGLIPHLEKKLAGGRP